MNGYLDRLFRILTPKEKGHLFLLAGLDLLMAVADVVSLIGLLLMIRVLTGNGSVPVKFAFLQQWLVSAPILAAGTFLLLFCIKNIAGVMILKAEHRYVYGVASRLSENNILSYLKGGYEQFVQVDSSIRIRQISNVPIEFSNYILSNFQQVIAQSVLILLTIAAILWYHPVLFLLLLVLLVPPIMLLGWFTRTRLKKVRAQVKQSNFKVIQYLHESLAGYVESNIYDKDQFFIRRYHQHQQQLNQSLATQQTLQGLSPRFIEIFALLGFFLLVAINKLYGGKTGIDVLTIGVFMAAAYKIIPGVVKILNSTGQMRTYSFLLDDLLINDAEQGIIPSNISTIATINFDQVSFCYQDNAIINNLSFGISKGDMAGISGVSGRGKTTIINLLLGFLQPGAGQISINGAAADAKQRQAFWPRISYVKQQSFFINDTILKNITLAESDHDTTRLNKALWVSGLDSFLSGQPERLGMLIKEHGKNISGGQRQRVALARALYHDHDLLILDEPFSEMDQDAERDILTRLNGCNNNGRMVLFITHNKASLSFCNKIIKPDAE